MTPTIRTQSLPSILPARLGESSTIPRQRYVVARILEGEGRSLSGPEQDSLSLRQRLDRLPVAERERLRQEAGAAFDSLAALPEETVAEYFYAGLLRAGRQAEDEDRFGVAQRCYFFLSRLSAHGMPVPEHVQRQARERLEVLSGGGSGWDRFEFAMTRLPRETLDPAFLVGMGAAAIVARGFRLRLLLGASRGVGITPRFVPQVFRAGVTAAVESLAYLTGHTATTGILGRPVAYDSIRDEWLR
ncbi:MAG TPA: hypothetical protein VFW62_03945, partial [bacterium]|nr:hypothetical protein [bacterium]